MNDPEMIASAPAEWFVVATGVAATVTANRPAEANRTHFITGVSISASGAPAAAQAVQVQDGATTIDRYELPASAFAPIIANFPRPYECTNNQAAQITVPSLGAGITCTVTIRGFTRMSPAT